MKHLVLRIMHWVAVLGCLCYAVAALGQLAQVSTSVTANNQQFDFNLSAVSHFDVSMLTIENTGNSSVAMPEIGVSGGAPVTNSAAVVAWLRSQSTGTDRSLAETTWRYITAHMTAYCSSGSRYDNQYGASSSWIMLHGYGFGCCTQSSAALAWLWHRAGLESRAAWWTGHAVSEVYYDGDWHMYDPDHRVYYTTADGDVANVAMVVADPSLVASGAGPNGLDPAGWTIAQMEALYRGAQVTYGEYDLWYPEPMYSLDPGEILYLNSENIIGDVIYRPVQGAWPIGPSAVTSETLVHPVDFTSGQWSSRVFSLADMSVVTTQLGTALTNTSSAGSVTLQKTWYGPALDLQLDGVFYRKSTNDVILVNFSTDGVSWSPPDSIAPTPGSFQHASLSLNGLARGAYSLYVMVNVLGNPGEIGISSLKLTTNFQTSKKVVPTLLAGTASQLIYRDASPDTQQRSVKVSVVVNEDQPAPIGMQLPKTQDQTVPSEPTVDDLESYLRAPLIFYPWLAYGSSTASGTLWQEQQSGTVLQAVAADASKYLVLGASLSWYPNQTGPTTWALAKREPTSLNFDWLETPRSTTWSGTLLVPISSPGDQFVVSVSQGGKAQLLGRPIYQSVTTTSLIPEDPIYSLARGYGASHLTDGLLRSMAYPGAPQFDYLVDLGTVAHVSAARLNWGYFGTNPIYIQTWILYGRKNPTDSWQVLGQGGFPGVETTSLTVDSYVSQLRIAATSTRWIGMFELSAAAAPLLPLSATSNIADLNNLETYGPPGRLVDGDESTFAYPGSYFNDYTLDPGAQAFIDTVRIVWGYFGTDADYVYSWRLYGQKELGTGWQIIARGGAPNAAASVVPVQNDYRRLRIAADGNNWIGIYEVEVHGNLVR